jgi:3'-phosphoadenosine 5'-phosphosulfate sulfotransferase
MPGLGRFRLSRNLGIPRQTAETKGLIRHAATWCASSVFLFCRADNAERAGGSRSSKSKALLTARLGSKSPVSYF